MTEDSIGYYSVILPLSSQGFEQRNTRDRIFLDSYLPNILQEILEFLVFTSLSLMLSPFE